MSSQSISKQLRAAVLGGFIASYASMGALADTEASASHNASTPNSAATQQQTRVVGNPKGFEFDFKSDKRPLFWAIGKKVSSQLRDAYVKMNKQPDDIKPLIPTKVIEGYPEDAAKAGISPLPSGAMSYNDFVKYVDFKKNDNGGKPVYPLVIIGVATPNDVAALGLNFNPIDKAIDKAQGEDVNISWRGRMNDVKLLAEHTVRKYAASEGANIPMIVRVIVDEDDQVYSAAVEKNLPIQDAIFVTVGGRFLVTALDPITPLASTHVTFATTLESLFESHNHVYNDDQKRAFEKCVTPFNKEYLKNKTDESNKVYEAGHSKCLADADNMVQMP